MINYKSVENKFFDRIKNPSKFGERCRSYQIVNQTGSRKSRRELWKFGKLMQKSSKLNIVYIEVCLRM